MPAGASSEGSATPRSVARASSTSARTALGRAVRCEAARGSDMRTLSWRSGAEVAGPRGGCRRARAPVRIPRRTTVWSRWAAAGAPARRPAGAGRHRHGRPTVAGQRRTRTGFPSPRTFGTANRATRRGRCQSRVGGASAGQEGQPDLALGVVDVEVDQADALPGAEREPAAEHRHAWRTAGRAPASRGSGRGRGCRAGAASGRRRAAGRPARRAGRRRCRRRSPGSRARRWRAARRRAAARRRVPDERGALGGEVAHDLGAAGAHADGRRIASAMLPAPPRRAEWAP